MKNFKLYINRFFLILFLGFLSAASGFARETVKGVVVDSKGEPVPGVKVEIPGSSEFTFTDLDGAFQITLRDPVKNLNFIYPGFGSISRRVQPEMKVMLGKGWEGNAKGFRGMVDLEGGIGFNGKATIVSGDCEVRNFQTYILPGVTYTLGYQINRHLFIGAGFGAYLDFTRYENPHRYDSYYYSYSSTELTGSYIPLYLAARWDFGLTKKTAPYIGLRIGYMQYLTDVDETLCSSYCYDGRYSSYMDVYGELCGSVFFSPSIGYRMSLHKKAGMNIGISYLAGMKKKLSAEASYGNSTKYLDITQRTSDAILFNIGFDF